MAKADVYLPEGFSAETKARFIQGMKDIFCESFGYLPKGSSITIREFKPENVCPYAASKFSVMVYYTVGGKTEPRKHKCAQLLDKLIDECFGDQRQPLYMIFKEHHMDNVVGRGKLKTFDPTYVPPYADNSK